MDDATLPAASPADAARLQRRARALATPHAAPEAAGGGELLIVLRGAERFGVPLGRIATVLANVPVTPLPGADAPVRGVLAWRNRALPLYDLAIGTPVPAGTATVVVLGDDRRAVGLLADVAEEIVHQAAGTNVAAVVTTAGTLPPFVREITADATMVVDVDALLDVFPVTR